MTKIINLTPHDVIIIQNGEVMRQYPPSGKVAKLDEWDATVPDPEHGFVVRGGGFLLDGVPVVRKQYGNVQVISRSDFLSKAEKPAVEPLPEEQNGIAYIVPMLVGQVLACQRNDLYGPDFGIGGVRTADGKISGAVGWIKY